MKLAIKIIIVLLVLIGVFFFWISRTTKIKGLEISDDDSQITKVQKADEWLQKIHEENNFNGGVLLIKNGEVILKKTYGFTDFSKSEKLTTQSSFRLASVSKQFTATGIMILKEKGKLNFDVSISEYLPELPYKEVTVRNLLNHTSGIPDIYMDFPKKYKEEIGSALDISEVVKLLAKENKPLESEPNSLFRYNNTGYVLLAGIIERVSGISFEEFMNQELFQKLKMNNTRVWNLVSKDQTFKNKTNSFENFLGNITELTPGVIDGVAGDGSVFSSLDDFIIWNQFWSENSLLSEETLGEAFKVPALNDGSKSNYGFGWILAENEGVWHNGSWLGARTLIARNETSKNCIVVLDNSSSIHVDFIGQQLAKALK